MTGDVGKASAPSHSSRPAAGRTNPASSRSSVDFPDPFGPASTKGAAGGHGQRQVAKHQPLAAEHRHVLCRQHFCPQIHFVEVASKADGRSPAGVVKARRREYFIRGVFSTPRRLNGRHPVNRGEMGA